MLPTLVGQPFKRTYRVSERGESEMRIGWLYLVLNVLSYGFWGFAAKVSLQKGASSYMSATLTSIGTVIITLLVFAPHLGSPRLRLDRSYIIPGIVAGLCVALGNLFLYKSLDTIPVSIAYPLSGLYILITVALAIVFLKEQITINHAIGIVCSMLAVFFLSR
jgi:transporter family protein